MVILEYKRIHGLLSILNIVNFFHFHSSFSCSVCFSHAQESSLHFHSSFLLQHHSILSSASIFILSAALFSPFSIVQSHCSITFSILYSHCSATLSFLYFLILTAESFYTFFILHSIFLPQRHCLLSSLCILYGVTFYPCQLPKNEE